MAVNHQPINSPGQLKEEQMPVADNKLHGWKHFAGLFAGEHVAATEFVIGATFVALGASTKNIIIGLLIGNFLAILSWRFLTAPIAVETRLSLYSYLNKIAGDSMTKLYNWANVLIFGVISAAMITVSSSAVRFLFDIPAQLDWYPSDYRFVIIVILVGIVVVLVAIYGFTALTEFSNICAPWLFVMFIGGALALLPALTHSVLGKTQLESMREFMTIADHSIWTGTTVDGESGIGLLGIIGFAWAANTLTHVGLIDMAILRFAKKKSYGYNSGFGMLFGHYIAWIAAGIMGAGTAVIVGSQVTELDPGDVAYYALGSAGFIIVIIAGWTTANANLYRAGLAAQAIFNQHSRKKVTLILGIATVIIACFPFVFSQMLPLLTYAGLIVVPVGAIVFTEHFIFPKIGYTRYWAHYKKLKFSTPAIASWGFGLLFGFGLNVLNLMLFYYIFVPTWIVTVFVYILLSKKYGATEQYPEEKRSDKKLMAEIKEYQLELAENAPLKEPELSSLTKVLNVISWGSLAIILVFAIQTMFFSPTLESYELNKWRFHTYTFIFTIVYFVTGYWGYKREKNKTDLIGGENNQKQIQEESLVNV